MGTVTFARNASAGRQFIARIGKTFKRRDIVGIKDVVYSQPSDQGSGETYPFCWHAVVSLDHSAGSPLPAFLERRFRPVVIAPNRGKPMPRYFFHVYYGGDPSSIDRDGLELADDHSAWSEAAGACGQMIAELDGAFEPGADWRMDVASSDGIPLFRFIFQGEHLAAAKSRKS